MIVGIGCDIFDTVRMKRELGKLGHSLATEIFTAREIAYCKTKRYPEWHLAARFAAKEALLKALGSGKQPGFAWTDIEVSSNGDGRPTIELFGEIKKAARRLRVKRIFLTMSHDNRWAVAIVVLES